MQTVFTWAQFADRSFEIAFYFDRLTAVMVLIVTGVGSLIHIYSIGYMHEDKSYARYFAYLNLFLFFMLMLVLGRSLLVLFVGWEGVGLASYLLIGFWFEDPAKAAAGKKAFITNRVGDAGFLLGMFLLYRALGTLQMDQINAAFLAGPVAVSASLVGVFLFIGATGKSAQIPLHVWLPDAMAGPTPVSALIHAATMVTAGVYLVARLHGIYLHAPEASALVATIGVATAFFAATIAVVQTDIKKVLAYSTISQLGFMFLAAGVGAYGVAVFHLYTHAFFKACLFLGAGSVIHAMSGEQDIRKMGGLAKKIPITFVTFAIATAAIAGLPPLAGFFSKDEILWFAFASEQGGAPWLFALAAATALMTAFYMFRLLWLTFFGTPRMDEKTAHHIHESPVVHDRRAGRPGGAVYGRRVLLDPALPRADAAAAVACVPNCITTKRRCIVLSVVIALVGLAGAALLLCAQRRTRSAGARHMSSRCTGCCRASTTSMNCTRHCIGRPIQWISDRIFLRVGDRLLLDGTLDGMAGTARGAAGLLVARADRQPALLRVPRPRRAGGGAAVELGPCLRRPC